MEKGKVKTVRFDEESYNWLLELDKKMNLATNHSAVIRHALECLYKKECKNEKE